MIEPQNDPKAPNFVWALRPQSPVPDWFYLFAHPATVSKWLEMGVRSKIGEYWGLVHGNFPDNPKSHVTPARTAGIRHPTAIFQGVRRPLHDGITNIDKDVLIYVTNPPMTYSV